jgi:hypothetical protein
VFTGCSSGVVCVTSLPQCAKSEIFEAQNSKDVNNIYIFILSINYRKGNCALQRCYAASRVNLILTIRDKQTLSFSRVFWPLMVVP